MRRELVMIPKKNSYVFNKILSMLLVIIIVSGSLLPSIGIALAKGESESTPFNTNLALNKKVTANNSHESNHVVSNMTDGDSSTRWSTKSTASSTIIVDL